MIETRHSNGLDLVIFPPSQLGVEIDSIGPSENGVATPHNFDWIASKGFSAALDGPMFTEPSSYSSYTQGRLEYGFVDRMSNTLVPSRHTSRGITIGADTFGNAVFSPGGYPPAGAVVSVQLYPTLLRAGSIEASQSIDSDITWRAGLGIMSDGRLAFAVGRMSMYNFARSLKAAGVVTAGYTDGGGSASLGSYGSYYGSSEKRRIPAWLVVRGGSPFSLSSLAIGAGVGLLAWWGYKMFAK